uniref:C2H2-type domain-containing protein n=1 Tax=Xiphophorus maculatus TaxID=8083 RepID=A0A3B5Q810_XIPMA
VFPSDSFNNCDNSKPRRDIFTQNSNLTQQLKGHIGEKRFPCTTCGKLHFTIHMRTHTDEKSSSCTICGEQFAQKGDLCDHMRIHTDERSFPCDTCEKTFRSKDALNKHQRNYKKHMQ